jgi:hypothetical protein
VAGQVHRLQPYGTHGGSGRGRTRAHFGAIDAANADRQVFSSFDLLMFEDGQSNSGGVDQALKLLDST